MYDNSELSSGIKADIEKDWSFNSPGITIAGVRLGGTKYLKKTHAKLRDEAFLSWVIEV